MAWNSSCRVEADDARVYSVIFLCFQIEEPCDIKIFRFDAPLYYGNVELFRDNLYSYCKTDMEKLVYELQEMCKFFLLLQLQKRLFCVENKSIEILHISGISNDL